jgi:hypothetical protein
VIQNDYAKKNWEALEAPKFKEDHNCKDLMGGFEAKGCYFQLG